MINYPLIREGFVPINITLVNRAKYYDAFSSYLKNHHTRIMESLVFGALTNSYYKRLTCLDGKTVITLNAHAKKHKLSHPNLINKAKRQTIEAFIEHGVWKIGKSAQAIMG